MSSKIYEMAVDISFLAFRNEVIACYNKNVALENDIMIQPLDITTDYIFKLVFGTEENKDVLISLLNAIFKGRPEVKDLKLMNSEISKILKDNKSIRLDVRADIGNRHYVDIEIQVRNTGDVIPRGIQYLCNMMTESAKRHSNRKLSSYAYPKVIGVWILKENVTTRIGAVNEIGPSFLENAYNDFEIATDKMRMFLVELKKFNPKTSDKKDLLDAWLKFLTNTADKETLKEKRIHKAYDTLMRVSADDEVREIYRLREKTENERISEQATALEEGIKKGKAEGLVEGEKIGVEKGRAEERAKAAAEKIEMAKNFLKMGLSIEQVAQGTGLSIDEVNQLQESFGE